MRAALVIAVLLFSSLARAQPSLTPPTPSEAVSPPARDPAVGYLLSGLGIVAPVMVLGATMKADANERGLLLTGATVILTPSAGHWYAGEFFTVGMGLRAGGTLMFGTALAAVLASDGGNDDAWIGTAAYGGLALIATGTIYDLVTTGSAVRRWNQRQLEVAPTALKLRDGYGFGLAGRF